MDEININTLSPEEQILSAHEFLKNFLTLFDKTTRGGIHDFMEISVYNMINHAVKNIDDYLAPGHDEVDATQIVHIVCDSYQKVLDNMKRNLGKMKEVRFK